MLKKSLFLVSLLTSVFLLTISLKSFADEPIGAPLGKQIKIASNLSYDQKRGVYIAKVILKNQKNSKTTFRGSLALLVQSISRPGISLTNASGQTSAGLSYVDVPLPAKGLKPGKTTKKITLIFKSTDRKQIKNLKIKYAAYLGLASSANFSSSSGAFGILALSGARIVFVPVGTTIKPVLLESANGVSLKEKITPKAGTLALSFNVDSCTVDGAALKVICVGFNSTKIALLDVSAFVTSFAVSDIKVSEFDSGAPNTRLSFSGGSCILCGVAADPGEGRFIVAANDGYRVYAYTSTTAAVSSVFSIPVVENFSFDSVRNRIIAPEYERSFSSSATGRAFNVVDLNKGKVYRWNKTTSSCSDLGAQTTNCIGDTADVDSAAVDLKTGIVELIFEHTSAVAMIDLGQASFDDASLTFSAPASYIETAAAPQQSAGGASATDNYLFLAEELGDSQTGVMRLPTASGVGGAFPAVNPNPVFVDLDGIANPECATNGGASYTFSTKGDPHGLALFTGLIGGKQTGLLIDRPNLCAALIDLAGLYSAPRSASNPTQVDASVNVRTSNIVRFVKLQ